eukprot:1803931-Alexandrium_andersonii.AAC.1
MFPCPQQGAGWVRCRRSRSARTRRKGRRRRGERTPSLSRAPRTAVQGGRSHVPPNSTAA